MVRERYAGDDANSIARSAVEQLAAIRKQLADNVAIPSGTVQVVNGAANGASTFDLSLAANAQIVEIDLVMNPVTNGSDIQMRVGAGGSIFSGAADYAYATLKGTTQSVSTGAAFGLIMPATSNSFASQFSLRIFQPGRTLRHWATWSGAMLDSTALSPNALNGGCRFLNNTNPIDTLRLLASAGNMNLTYVMRTTFGG